MPASISDLLSKLIANFLWGSLDLHTIHWVKWETLCLPKDFGGLGLVDFKTKNYALLCKWLWRYASEPNSFWRKTIAAIYEKDPIPLLPQNVGVSNKSWIWRSIVSKIASPGNVFSKNISFFVGDGSRIQFWSDIWIETASLRSCYPRIYALSSKKAGIIAGFGKFTNGLWNWNIPLRRALFDWELEVWDLFIDTINCGKVRLGIQDSVWWNSDSNDSFSVKSLLNLIGPPLGIKDVVWKYCWSKLAPPNVEFFVWKAAYGRLATKVEMLKRNFNIQDSVLCPLCSIEQESISHLLCHCQVSWSI
ncbi:hypothetical protein V6N13_110242 [Hibiscus sabdariffa]